ncbi:MAG: DUF488 domain-containing protein [Phycisphaerae bacterium]|jgi:uncharacterized protein (DUF488 family)
MSNETIAVYTIGFSKKGAAAFFGKLEDAGVRCVIDVRLRNMSHLAGFTKRDDLRFFLRRIGNTNYVHVPELAPTAALLDDYQKGKIDWPTYERRFNEIIAERRIENLVTPEQLQDACLLCSEAEPAKCHRRLVAEYLQRQWNNVRIRHIL